MMAAIVIDKNKCVLCEACISACPFGALENKDGNIEVNGNCRLCKGCIGACPAGAISIDQRENSGLDKSLYCGIAVYVEHEAAEIQPVTFELIGKARKLAAEVKHRVYAVFIGDNIEEAAQQLLSYGVDEVLVYQHPEYRSFRVDNYAEAFSDALRRIKPSVVLFAATTVGRSLAPTIATRFKTGLTADTTDLIMRENTDLVQIRPAFGGNIMAQIITSGSRPQFATVREKVFEKAKKTEVRGKAVLQEVTDALTASRIEVLNVEKMPPVTDISAAEIIVCAGNGVRTDSAFELIKELASLLKAALAGSRPLIERGLLTVNHQIGLSGRTVRPELIICVGVSGAIQFTSGMSSAKTIISINSDPEAPINKLAHYAVIGDLNEILPELVRLIKGDS